MPLCKECDENETQHVVECKLIRSWKFSNNNIKFNKHLFRSLTLLRGLILSPEKEEIMLHMASHDEAKVENLEVQRLLEEFKGGAASQSAEIIDKLKIISNIVNTNAFELGVKTSSEKDNSENAVISLRVKISFFIYIKLKIENFKLGIFFDYAY